jgi:hypothetical protein
MSALKRWQIIFFWSMLAYLFITGYWLIVTQCFNKKVPMAVNYLLLGEKTMFFLPFSRWWDGLAAFFITPLFFWLIVNDDIEKKFNNRLSLNKIGMYIFIANLFLFLVPRLFQTSGSLTGGFLVGLIFGIIIYLVGSFIAKSKVARSFKIFGAIMTLLGMYIIGALTLDLVFLLIIVFFLGTVCFSILTEENQKNPDDR